MLAAVPGRRVGVTVVDGPGPGQFGVVDGRLARPPPSTASRSSRSRGGDDPPGRSAQRQPTRCTRRRWPARTGVAADASGTGWPATPPNRTATRWWPRVAGVAYVDDSKATNPHAARRRSRRTPVVWVAGGQLKGVDIADLVAAVADRLVGAVLLGVDRAQVAAALARHAPQPPRGRRGEDR